jgi:hypothetical protein
MKAHEAARPGVSGSNDRGSEQPGAVHNRVSSAARGLVATCWAGLFACLATSCATNAFQGWDQQFKKMIESGPASGAFYREQDVSLVLGSEPLRCEDVPSSTPKIGVLFDKKRPVVVGVFPYSPAAVAGVGLGDKLLAVDGHAVEQTGDLLRLLGSRAQEGPVALKTTSGIYSIDPEVPRIHQCYWEVSSGPVQRSSAAASWNRYGGQAQSGGAAYHRYYRLTARFQNGWLITFQSNWQM